MEIVAQIMWWTAFGANIGSLYMNHKAYKRWCKLADEYWELIRKQHGDKPCG